MHCLQFDLGNQILNPEEDKLNKADRPLATGRISLPAARALRWLSVPACLVLSACYSAEAVYASLGSALLSGMYNELGGHRNWVTRTALLATNLACFELGACLVAGQKPSLDMTRREHVLRETGLVTGPNPHVVNKAAALSIFLSTGAYGTTNQATDFKDIEGDKLMRRKTLPIAAPRLARPTLFLLMLSWSIAVTRVWELDTLASLVFNVLGFAIGVRFLAFNDIPADKTSCLLYNVSLAVANADDFGQYSTEIRSRCGFRLFMSSLRIVASSGQVTTGC